ncbi:MAG: hypothetical protein IJ015_04720 [Ruminococcus sp.]|nr:hypothetical protein [Ruminococcus sp.]
MILGSWSGMRKYLEQEMIADSLKNRIRYDCTTYKGMDGWKVFEIYIDKRLFKRFSLETVNTYFIESGYKENNEPFGKTEYWTDFWEILEKTPISERREYTDNEFCDALAEYRNQDIRKSVYSENPIVKMFAILDRRVGKRTLSNLKEQLELQPKWLQDLFKLRLGAEYV